jgi:hypothetical protein
MMLQDTPVFVVPVTDAVNCFCVPAVTCAVDGEMLTATGGAMVTAAEADADGSATEVAVTVTCGEDGTLEGAVYRPSPVREPQEDPEQAAPLNCQVTPVMVVPLTKATNRCCWPTTTFAWVGDRDTTTSEDAPNITEALADAVRSAREVAVTVITLDAGAVAGAR